MGWSPPGPPSSILISTCFHSPRVHSFFSIVSRKDLDPNEFWKCGLQHSCIHLRSVLKIHLLRLQDFANPLREGSKYVDNFMHTSSSCWRFASSLKLGVLILLGLSSPLKSWDSISGISWYSFRALLWVLDDSSSLVRTLFECLTTPLHWFRVLTECLITLSHLLCFSYQYLEASVLWI